MRYLAVLVLSLNALVFVPSNAKPLSLEEAIELAKNEGSYFKKLKLELSKARLDYEHEKIHSLPTASLFFGYAYEENRFASEKFGLGSLQLRYNLFDRPRDLGLESATKQLQAIENEVKLSESNLESKVELAYYRLVESREKQAALLRLIQRTEAQIAIVRRRLKGGRATKSDLYEFQLGLAELKSEQSVLQSENKLLERNLLRYLGGRVQSVEPTTKLDHYHLETSRHDLLRSIESSPVLARLKALEDQAQIEAKRKASMSMPTLGVSLEAGYLDPDFSINENEPQVEGMVFLSWSLFPEVFFSAGREAAKVAHQIQSLHSQLEGNSLKCFVQNKVDEIRSLQNQIDQQRDRLKLARLLYDSVATEYKRGVKSSGDVEVASRRVYEAEVADVENRLRFIEDIRVLEESLGISLLIEKH